MKKNILLAAGLGAFFVLAACDSGPSSSSSAGSEAAALERKADFLEALAARRPLAAQSFDALISALPDRVWLTEIVFDPKGIQAKGIAPSNTVLADYISSLAESSPLADVMLRGSSLRTARGREWVEFLLQAAVREPGAAAAEGQHAADRAARLEKSLPVRQAPSEMLRELQRTALDAGLQMTKFVPGVEVAGEFTGELAATIEVAGDPAEVGDYLRGLAGLSRLWIVERFSLKALTANDPRSEVRASVAAKAYFAR